MTPAIALVTVFDVDVPATPSTVNSAFLPSFAVPAFSLSAAAVSDTLMNSAPLAPVARLEKTIVSPLVTAA